MFDPICAAVFVALFMTYGTYGIWLEYQLNPYRRNVSEPEHEDMFPAGRARRLFRRERIWRRWRVVVWIGTFVLLNVLCARDLWKATAAEHGRFDPATRQTARLSHP